MHFTSVDIYFPQQQKNQDIYLFRKEAVA